MWLPLKLMAVLSLSEELISYNNSEKNTVVNNFEKHQSSFNFGMSN